MRQWFRTAEPLGERRYENLNTHTHTDSYNWTDARRPVPWLWIRSTEVRGGRGGTSLGEWEHNKNEIHINPSSGYYAQVAVSPGDHSLRLIKLQQDAYYPHPVSSELENSGIRVAVGDCSVTERWRWRPPYQAGKTVHGHAKHYKHNEDGRTAPGVCGKGSVPLSHSGNVVTRIGIHT